MATREEYVAFAREQAAAAGIDADLFLRQIGVESNWDPAAVSPAGARGIAQIVPWWHPGVNPDDPWASLRYAARLMRSHLDQFGSYRLALAAYNAGGGNVQKYGGVPPFEETKRYLTLILGPGWPEPGGAGTAAGNGQTSETGQASAGGNGGNGGNGGSGSSGSSGGSGGSGVDAEIQRRRRLLLLLGLVAVVAIESI